MDSALEEGVACMETNSRESTTEICEVGLELEDRLSWKRKQKLSKTTATTETT